MTVFSRDALRKLLESVGLVDVEVLRVEHQGAVSWWKWLRRVVGNVVRPLTGRRPAPMHYFHDHQLVLARKPQTAAI